ncbi:MAG TPA: response regulator transcription factor [Bacteroidales bacterium]|nr:response regulator transcription factor [Bacteroidales bacterium]
MAKIKVLLVDDHDIVILGLKALLSRNRDIDIVAVTNDGEETLKKVEELEPDVVVLDIDLPKISGIEVTEKITQLYPNTKVLLHTSFADEEHIVAGFEAGASGYIPKSFKKEQLLEAIRTVHKGEKYIKGNVSELFINNYFKAKKTEEITENSQETLTKREIEILRCITDGHSNQVTAEKLNISVRTVEAHKHNIMNKLKIFNTADLVKYALKNKIISI